MMFNYKHYIPALRWKASEKEALKMVHERLQGIITPLIELVPEKISNSDNIIYKLCDDLNNCWAGKPFFIDFSLIPAKYKTHAIVSKIYDRAKSQNLYLIPTIGINSPIEYQNAIANILKNSNSDVCIRLFIEDIDKSSFNKDLRDMLTRLDIPIKRIHLLIDLKIAHSVVIDYKELCEKILDIDEWKTFSIISGAFPKDLTGFRPGQHIIARYDWLNWLNEIQKYKGAIRLPSFGDYTIQHPIYYDPIKHANVSASIRYTSANCWVIMRGEGLRNEGGPGHSQYPANALLLCERPEYCGSDFSEGDKYIYDTSRQTTHPGIPKTWLRAGINHHITFVANQITNLS